MERLVDGARPWPRWKRCRLALERVSAASTRAAEVLEELLDAESGSTRLRAAVALLDLCDRMIETRELAERLEALASVPPALPSRPDRPPTREELELARKLLTPRRYDDWRMWVDGVGYRRIGLALHMAPETARSHVHAAVRTLGRARS